MVTVDQVSNIISKIQKNKNSINRQDIVSLLKARNDAQKVLFEFAETVRKEQMGNKVYIRGVMDISNYCRCTCAFCGNSAKSKNINRYRLTKEEMIESIYYAKEIGIDVIHLASGEDRRFNVDDLFYTVEEIINLGLIPELVLSDIQKPLYKEFYQLGVRRYIMKFETSNPDLFAKVKTCHRSFEETINTMKYIKSLGYQFGSGNIVGLPGQTIEMLADDILLLKELNVDMASTSCMQPNMESEYAYQKAGDPILTLNFLSLLRMLLPNEKLCVPTNSTFGKEGKLKALKLGANELSLNITPRNHNGEYSIYSGKDRYKADLETTLGYIHNAGMTRSTYKEMYQVEV